MKWLLIPVVLLCGGCLEGTKTTQEQIIEAQSTLHATLDAFKAGLVEDAAKAKEDSFIHDVLDRVTKVEAVVEEYDPIINEVTDTIINADNNTEMAWGIGEIAAGMLGLGGLFGAVNETRKRKRSDSNLARTEQVIRNSSVKFTEGQMAQLPSVIRQAAVSNGN